MITRFSAFLNESRAQQLSQDDAISILKENCKVLLDTTQKLDTAYLFQRFSDTPHNFSLINPIEHTRSARGMLSSGDGNHYDNSGYHNLWMSENLKWQNYPNRSKSLIMSVRSEFEKSNYGKNKFAVFPFDNAKLAIASHDDIWFSFENGLKEAKHKLGEACPLSGGTSITDLFNWLDKLVNATNYLPTDYTELSYVLDNASIIGEEQKNETIILINNEYGGLKQMLSRIMDPDLNNFTLKTVQDENLWNLPRGKEIWTSDKCLLINANNTNIFSILDKARN